MWPGCPPCRDAVPQGAEPATPQPAGQGEGEGEDEGGEFEVAEEVEEVIERLLAGLRDKVRALWAGGAQCSYGARCLAAQPALPPSLFPLILVSQP